jgi:hypothetical protein
VVAGAGPLSQSLPALKADLHGVRLLLAIVLGTLAGLLTAELVQRRHAAAAERAARTYRPDHPLLAC